LEFRLQAKGALTHHCRLKAELQTSKTAELTFVIALGNLKNDSSRNTCVSDFFFAKS